MIARLILATSRTWVSLIRDPLDAAENLKLVATTHADFDAVELAWPAITFTSRHSLRSLTRMNA